MLLACVHDVLVSVVSNRVHLQFHPESHLAFLGTDLSLKFRVPAQGMLSPSTSFLVSNSCPDEQIFFDQVLSKLTNASIMNLFERSPLGAQLVQLKQESIKIKAHLELVDQMTDCLLFPQRSQTKL